MQCNAMVMVTASVLVASYAGSAPAQFVHRAATPGNCRDYAVAHPEKHLVGGTGANSCEYQIPPKGFDTLAASQADLAGWGIPPRPDTNDTVRFAKWKKIADAITSPDRVMLPAFQCTQNFSDFKGPPRYYSLCGVTPDGKHMQPRTHKPIPYTQPLHQGMLLPGLLPSGEGGATQMPTTNYAGFLISFNTRKTMGAASTFGYMASAYETPAVSVASFYDPIATCGSQAVGSPRSKIDVATWYGLFDKDAPDNTGLDQAGVETEYDCATHSYTISTFVEELPNPPVETVCAAGHGLNPGDQYLGWVVTNYSFPGGGGQPTPSYPYSTFISPNGSDHTCLYNGLIPPGAQPTASQGQGGAIIAETQTKAPYIPAPMINYQYNGFDPEVLWLYLVQGGYAEGQTSIFGPLLDTDPYSVIQYYLVTPSGTKAWSAPQGQQVPRADITDCRHNLCD